MAEEGGHNARNVRQAVKLSYQASSQTVQIMLKYSYLSAYDDLFACRLTFCFL